MKSFEHKRSGSVLAETLVRLRKWSLHRKILTAHRRGGAKQGRIFSRFISFEGLRYHLYFTRNGRPPLILLHGFLDSAQTFRRFLPVLAEHFELYVFDIPGFGYTRLPSVRGLWDIPAISRGLLRLLQKLEIKNARVWTHSMGGVIAAHMARHLNETGGEPLFSELHLMCPGILKLETVDRNSRRKLLFPENVTEIHDLFQQLYFRQMPEIPGLLLSGLLRQWTQVGYFYLAENMIEREEEAFFNMAQLRSLGVPLTLYWGEQDQLTPLEIAIQIQRGVPGTGLVTFGEAAHALHLEKTGEVLEAFLRNVGVGFSG